MSDHQRSVRVGAAAIVLAVVFRLGAWGLPGMVVNWLKKTNIAAFAIYLETGRTVRFSASEEVFLMEYAPESAPPVIPVPEEAVPLLSLPGYGSDPIPALTNTAGREADLQALLESPLSWDLTVGEPAVLIYHTHATESYTKAGESYEESASWRTLSEDHNMISIGARVAELLEAAGIRVIQDRGLHDYPSYNGSYANSRESAQALLDGNPGILLMLDLHRDAADAPGGGQMRTLVRLGEQDCAQLMIVMGANFEGWEANLSLALKLNAQLERQAPGITRPIQLRNATFNQDLNPGALLVEVGAAGNTRQEALLAAEELAKAIITLAGGTAGGVD